MISITSKTGSSDGVIFQESKTSGFKTFQPRVTKSKTLDGAVVYDHRGMVEADRVFNIKASYLTQAQVSAIQNIIENETYVNLSTDEAFFEGVISRAELDRGFLNMDFWVYVPVAEESGSTKRMYEHENITITESYDVAVGNVNVEDITVTESITAAVS
jgi:hypothetical protein